MHALIGYLLLGALVLLLSRFVIAPLLWKTWFYGWRLGFARQRIGGWIRQDIAKKTEFSCLKNIGTTVAICAMVTLILMPFFPL